MDPSALATIQRAGARRYPNEAGGLLLGSTGARGSCRVSRAVELVDPNASPFHYAADPTVVRDYVFGRVPGASPVVGMFHTHPRGPAVPSALDTKCAGVGYLYVIAVPRASPPKVRGFRTLRPGGPMIESDVRLARSRGRHRTVEGREKH